MRFFDRVLFGGALLAASLSTSGLSGSAPAIDPAVLEAREAAWRAYFGGDLATLGRLLPEDFIGIGMNAGPFADRETTLRGAREFSAGGGRLLRLTFPETRAQRAGDVVVLYGRYEAVIVSAGTERTLEGRLTEVFLRTNGRWVHPGWHLDLTAGADPEQR